MLHIKGTAVRDTLEAIKARSGEKELDRILAHLDEEAKEIFRAPISPSSWYSCDAFARFLEADIRETASGNQEELIKRSEAVIEKQLSGIYKMFVRLGSPEFVIRRIAAVHSTYFDGVQIIPEMKGPKSATIQYVGFSRNHRIMGFVILGFFRKALEISGAKKVDVHFTVPIEAGEKFCELALSWD
jgi:alkanesulfonate monooxygenase SsuD/methylene tetrahydromethanopterin reductase-like flavin-dependent oxidoreductase (luciferase family)